MGIHDYEKSYQAALGRIDKADILAKNRQHIYNFIDDMVLENLSKPRLVKYIEVLVGLGKLTKKDFKKAELQDIKAMVAEIQKRDYSAWTKQSYKVILRKFYKWLYKSDEYPKLVSWIPTNINKAEMNLPSEGELLTEDDIKKLISKADHPRDKAFVSMLWESGARISEIGNLCMKNIAFDKHGTVITVKGKTGSRKIRLITSTPLLSSWMNVHPYKNDPKAQLWVNIGVTGRNKPMVYSSWRFLLIRLFKKADINKRSNPHLFRHSRATFMANFLTEFQMNQYFGWIQGSDMPSTYVHMSGKSVDAALFAMNGIEQEGSKEPSKLQPRICPRCNTINTYESKHCCQCGGILDIKYAMELESQRKEEIKQRGNADELMNMLLKDNDVQALLAEKLKGLTAGGLSF